MRASPRLLIAAAVLIAAALGALVLALKSGPRAIGTATDLNVDGRSDLLYWNNATGQALHLDMNGFAVIGKGVIHTEPDTAWRIVADADFTGDGITDLLWRNARTGQVWLMPVNVNGYGGGGGAIYTEPDPAWKIVQTPDLDGDGRADLLWWNASTGQLFAMLMGDRALGTQGLVYTEPDTAWKVVACGDFAGSGRKNQLLWRNSVTGQVHMLTVTLSEGKFLAKGTTIYQEPDTKWKIVGAADFDGDGRSDMLWRNDATGQVHLMLMHGLSIGTHGLVHHEPNLSWKLVAHGDYNGDGKADLLWRNEATGDVHMMLMDGLRIASHATVHREPDTAWKLMGPEQYSRGNGTVR